MDNIKALLKAASQQYNRGLEHSGHCQNLCTAAHTKLSNDAEYVAYGQFSGRPPIPYHVFSLNNSVSRPIRADIYISNPNIFAAAYADFIQSLQAGTDSWTEEDLTRANQVLYTAVMAVACCYDIWQRGSRKTPGTFFEILMASFLKIMLPQAVFSKHIPLAALLHDTDVAEIETDIENDDEEDKGGSVSTDLVVGYPDRPGGVVIPMKITTRERIVQPFAHQRILESAFGEGVYQSLLVCISETQLDDKTRSVKQVCVPGTVKLFQKYLASISGLYYCDLPQRYVADDMQKIIPVQSTGQFFIDISRLMSSHTAKRN